MEVTDTGNVGNDVTNTGADTGSNLDTSPAQPSVIEIPDENALIKVKGQEKPVKYGEHIKGFQSQFTKASQRAAQLERELATERQRREQYERERQAAQAQSQATEAGDVYAALEALPYLNGSQAAQVVRAIASELQTRDRYLAGMTQYIKQMESRLGQLFENHSQSSFDTKISRALEGLGYGPEYKDIAAEVYLAYEPGPELDQEFPNILKARIEAIETALEARKRAAVDRNRQNRFVPGRGGATGPNRPLQFKGTESAAEVTEALWEQLHGSGT